MKNGENRGRESLIEAHRIEILTVNQNFNPYLIERIIRPIPKSPLNPSLGSLEHREGMNIHAMKSVERLHITDIVT